jgi:hypothetical protein
MGGMVRRSRNVAAYERTVGALRKLGRLEPVDAAVVAMGRTLAELMDAAEEPTTQTAWAYLAVLKQLRGEVALATSDDDLAALLAVLSAQVGDAPES